MIVIAPMIVIKAGYVYDIGDGSDNDNEDYY